MKPMAIFKGNTAPIFPEGVFILGTYDENGRPDAMNAAWGVQSDYGEISFYLAEHKTTENLKKTGAFTVAFATADTVTISDYFGLVSGNKVDKIREAGVHVSRAPHVNAPIIEEYPVTLECLVKSYDDKTGILVGTIVDEIASESVLTDGKVDADKLKPICYDPSIHAYRVLGPVVAKAFSEGRKLIKK
jgi:flavin reductase (DIM6/NTAB) family NADH-FMN oxidoreductase RutF